MRRKTKIRALLLGALALFSVALSAQDQEAVVKKTKVKDDLEFAMLLARHRYFDLANDFVTRIKTGQMTSEDEATLLLANAQILRWAAEFGTAQNERVDFYQQAIQRFKEFVEYHTDHPDFNKARVDMASVQQSYGVFLSDEIRQAGDPQRRSELKEQAETAFRECSLLLNDAVRDLKKLSEAYLSSGEEELGSRAERQAAEAEYKKGVSYYYWSLIYDKDDFNRGDYLQRCIDTLDEYIWEAEEGDFWTLWAYVFQSRAYTEMKEYNQAFDLAAQVYDVELGIPLEDREKKKLSAEFAGLAPEYLKLITDLVESAYLQTATVRSLTGNYEDAISIVNQLKSLFERCGLELSSIGDEALLTQADAFRLLNNVPMATEVAQIVADRNTGNDVGRRAKVFLQDTIKDVLDAPGALSGDDTIPPDVLFTAAEGSYIEGKYFEAIHGFYRVFRVLKSVDQEKEWTADTWYSIGQCYEQLHRPLEASLAYKEGFMSPQAQADKELYEKNGNRWYLAASKRFKITNDRFDEAVMRAARETLVKAGVSTDLLFFIATEKFAAAQAAQGEERGELMRDAIDAFKDVPKTSQFYERSLIYLARAYADLANYDEALKRLDEFDEYVARSPAAGTPAQKGARQGTMAEAVFYRAEIYLTLERYAEAYDLVAGFEEQFQSQPGFFAPILHDRILAKLGLRDFAAAEKLFREMEEKYKDSPRFPVATYQIGKAFVLAAEEKRGDTAQPPPEEYRALLKKGADYMYRYCQASSFDSFTNLANVADWYKGLGDLKTARAVYEKVIEEFGKKAEYQDQIAASVNRSYGEVLLSLKDFQAAKPVWLRLLSTDMKNPTFLKSTALCLGGWLEKEGESFIEIPGSGDYLPADDADSEAIRFDNALSIWKYIWKALSVDKEYSPEWWEAKFASVYCYYMGGAQNLQCYETAETLIKNAELYHPDLGGTEFKAKFKYLEKSIRARKR